MLVSSPVVAQAEGQPMDVRASDEARAVSETQPEPRAPFGSRGQWVVLGSSNAFGISNRTFSNSSAKFFEVGGAIGVDTFVIRNLSVGFDVGASYGDIQGYGATTLTKTTSTSISGGVRFGVNLPLGDSFSWYPRLTVGVLSGHSDTSTVSSSSGAPLPPPSSQSSVGPWLNLYAPLLMHPVPHLFAGFGPRLQHEFAVTRGGPYDGAQSTLVSGEFVVGGFWGGPAPEGAAPRTKQLEHRFGEKGQTVLTVATAASLSFQTYSNSTASGTNVNLAPGFDSFVLDNISVGVDLVVGYAHGTSLDSTGVPSDFGSNGFGFGPRVGVNIPLAGLLSLFSQLELGFGKLETKQSSVRGTNQHSNRRSWGRLSAPLLVHAASHLFVGLGPYLFHELSDTDQFNYENEATSVGGDFVLGGWL